MKYLKKLAVFLIAIMIAFTSAAAISLVDENGTITVEAASKEVKLSTKSKTIAKGTSFNLSVKNAGSKKVKWSTTKKSVASIKKVSKTKYKITAKKKGTATIKVKVGSKTYKCKVTVTNPKISTTSKSVTVGNSFNLSVSGGKGTVKWSTSDKSVASIKKVSNTKYKVSAKKKGTATIKAKINGKILKCKVIVKAKGSNSSSNSNSSSSTSGSSTSGSSSSGSSSSGSSSSGSSSSGSSNTSSDGYSYELYLVSAENIYDEGYTSCFYLKTDNPDIRIAFLDGTGIAALTARGCKDVEGMEDYVDLVKVDGGYFFRQVFNTSGKIATDLKIILNGASLYAQTTVKTYTLNVLSTEDARNDWIDGLIKDYTNSSMTPIEKMDSICSYLKSSEAGFKYPANFEGDSTALNLTTEYGPPFITHVWDSATSPKYLAYIAERIGGFEDVHNCYSDYTRGTTEWENYHSKCRVTYNNVDYYYSVCPATSTGTITTDDIKYIDFTSTKDMTKIG